MGIWLDKINLAAKYFDARNGWEETDDVILQLGEVVIVGQICLHGIFIARQCHQLDVNGVFVMAMRHHP